MTKKDTFTFIGLYIMINLLLVYAFNTMVFDESFYFNVLGNQFEFEDIQKFVLANNKVAILSYVLIPLIVVIRIITVSSVFKIYSELSDENFHYHSFLEIALIAEVVFVFQVVLKFAFILFYGTSIENAQTMSVLFSLNQVFKSKPDYLSYLFSCISLFDVLYFFVLAYAYNSKFKSGLLKALNVTTFSYIPLLLLWIVVITFITM